MALFCSNNVAELIGPPSLHLCHHYHACHNI